MSGVWRVTYSMYSQVYTEEWNAAWLYHNGHVVQESVHYTSSGYYRVRSTSGRQLIMEASAGDSISLRTTGVDGDFEHILMCFEFISTI